MNCHFLLLGNCTKYNSLSSVVCLFTFYCCVVCFLFRFGFFSIPWLGFRLLDLGHTSMQALDNRKLEQFVFFGLIDLSGNAVPHSVRLVWQNNSTFCLSVYLQEEFSYFQLQKMMKLLFGVLFLLIVLCCVCSKKVLVLPLQGRSHMISTNIIGKELMKEGHEVSRFTLCSKCREAFFSFCLSNTSPYSPCCRHHGQHQTPPPYPCPNYQMPHMH